MRYILYIRIDDDRVRNYYENSVQTFNEHMNDFHRDSGFDLYVPEEFQTTGITETPLKIDHGVSCSLYKVQDIGDEHISVASGYYMYPRSSISKTPLRLANSVGIIDSGYRGHLIAKVDCISNESYTVCQGDRLFQICTPDLTPFERIEIVESFGDDNTTRGDGGFGSTGR